MRLGQADCIGRRRECDRNVRVLDHMSVDNNIGFRAAVYHHQLNVK